MRRVAADAHDVGPYGAGRWEGRRLMLMMLARFGLLGGKGGG